MRNRYNQIPHLTQNTIRESDKKATQLWKKSVSPDKLKLYCHEKQNKALLYFSQSFALTLACVFYSSQSATIFHSGQEDYLFILGQPVLSRG